MELDRDEIIKALECCRYGGRCVECPCFEIPNCQALANKNALSLIKELTEENERLHASCTELTQNLHECKADTVRKMQERLKDNLSYGIRNVNHRIVDQIAKEILEGK